MGTGRRGARALGLPEFQILHEVFHGHLVQKHKVGLAALRASVVLHPAGAGSTQARLPQPSCALCLFFISVVLWKWVLLVPGRGCRPRLLSPPKGL